MARPSVSRTTMSAMASATVPSPPRIKIISVPIFSCSVTGRSATRP
jgi:hypothetical protein